MKKIFLSIILPLSLFGSINTPLKQSKKSIIQKMAKYSDRLDEYKYNACDDREYYFILGQISGLNEAIFIIHDFQQLDKSINQIRNNIL